MQEAYAQGFLQPDMSAYMYGTKTAFFITGVKTRLALQGREPDRCKDGTVQLRMPPWHTGP